MGLVLIDVNTQYTIEYESTKFTCKPILADEMALYMDMSASFEKDGKMRTQLNMRNYAIVADHVTGADGIFDANGNKVPWNKSLVQRLSMDAINYIANQLLEKNTLQDDEIKN